MNKIIYIILCLMLISFVSAANNTNQNITQLNRTQELELMVNDTLGKIEGQKQNTTEINKTEKKPFVMPKPTDIKQIFIVVAIVLGVIVIGILIIWRMMFRGKKYMIDDNEEEKPDKKEVQDLIDKI